MAASLDERRRQAVARLRGLGRGEGGPLADRRRQAVERLRGLGAGSRKQIGSIEEFLKAWEEEDIDIMELLSNIPGSAMEFGGDVASALGEIVTSPIETAKALGTLGVGVADLPFRAAGAEATGIQKSGREALGGLVGSIAGSATPSGITKRPVEALANLAIGGGTALKGLGALSRVGKMPQVAQTLQKAGKTAMAADPTTMPFRAAGAGLRAAGRITKKGAQATGRGIGKAAESIRGVSAAGETIPLWKELIASGLAFTTGTSVNTILLTMEKASAKLGDVIRNARRDRAGAWEDIIKRGAKATETIRDEASAMFDEFKKKLSRVDEKTGTSAYDVPVAHSAIADGIEETLKEYNIKLTRRVELDKPKLGDTTQELARRSVKEVLQQDRPYPDPVRRVKYTVEFDVGDRKTTISDMGDNRKIIKKRVEDLLNEYKVVPGDPAAFKLGHLWDEQHKIGDVISTLSRSDEISARTLAVFSDIRSQLSNSFKSHAKERLGPDAMAAMGKYENAKIALDEYADLTGITPGMVTAEGKLSQGLKNASVSKMNQALNEGKEHVLERLRRLERISGDDEMLARMVGASMSPLVGSGLVVKSEISQAMRSLAAVAAGANLPAIISIPAVLLFSPRAVNEILLQLVGSRAIRNIPPAVKRNLQQLVQSVRAMNPKLKPLGIDLRDLAKEGVTIGVLMERLQETAQAEEEQTRR